MPCSSPSQPRRQQLTFSWSADLNFFVILSFHLTVWDDGKKACQVCVLSLFEYISLSPWDLCLDGISGWNCDCKLISIPVLEFVLSSPQLFSDRERESQSVSLKGQFPSLVLIHLNIFPSSWGFFLSFASPLSAILTAIRYTFARAVLLPLLPIRSPVLHGAEEFVAMHVGKKNLLLLPT